MRLYWFLPFLLLLGITSCSESPYAFEDKVYADMQHYADSCGFDLEKALNEVENNYVEHGVLTSKSGKAKYDFFKKVVETGQVTGVNFPMNKDLFTHFHSFNAIDYAMKRGSIDTSDYKASKFYQLQLKAKQLMHSGTISPAAAAKLYIDCFTAEDLEHPFYRAQVLIVLNTILEMETAYIKEIKKLKENRFEDYDFPDALTIRITSDNKLLVDGNTTSIEEMQKRVEALLQKSREESSHHVRLKCSKKASYALYAEVTETIQFAYSNVCIDFAHKEYGRELSALTTTERANLEKRHPLRLYESDME